MLRLIIICLLGLTLLAPMVNAEEKPINIVSCRSATQTMLTAGKDLVIFSYDAKGIDQDLNEDKVFVNFTHQCLGTIRVMGGEVLAGLGGAVTAPFVGADKAAGFVEHLQENIPTYTPRTQTGTQGMIDMGQFLQDTQDNIANSRYGPALQQAQTNFNVSADYLNKNYGPEAATALKLLPDLIL